jgi:hypothetical protein
LSFLAGASLAVAYAAISTFSPLTSQPECTCRCVAETCPAPSSVEVAEAPAACTLASALAPAEEQQRAGVSGVREFVEPIGGLARDSIRSVVRGNIHEVRTCYNAALEIDPETAGRVVVQIKIGASGAVRSTTIESDDTGDAALGPCIAAKIEGWTFPELADGESVAITYPFVLEPG